MNWLITGGCGFIGLNLVKNLIETGEHYIRIVDNLSVGTRQDLSQVCSFTELDIKLQSQESSILSLQNPSQSSVFNSKSFSSGASHESKPDSEDAVLSATPGKVDLIVADILDAQMALKAGQEIDVIVHLAASTGVAPSVKDPRYDCLNNVIGTLNYLEAARSNDVKRFIFASSGAPVGECEPPIHEDIVPHPVSPYGASKLSGEAYCSAYFRSYGVKTIALRFGNVYGPLSSKKNSVVAKFIKRAIKGKTLEIHGEGTQTRDFIYIDDLIQALRLSVNYMPLNSRHLSLNLSPWGENFQIASNSETTIIELIDKLIPILTKSGVENVKVYHTDKRIGDVRRNFSDISKAKRVLGWQSYTPLREGLKLTVKWFIQHFSP